MQNDQRDKKETALAKMVRVKAKNTLQCIQLYSIQLAEIKLVEVALLNIISLVSSVCFWKEKVNTRIHVENYWTADSLLEFVKAAEFRTH